MNTVSAPAPLSHRRHGPSIAVALLIVYGTVYPLQFSLPSQSALDQFFGEFGLWTGRADMLGNVALFVPWGIASLLAWPTHRQHAVVWAVLSGLVLAAVCQALQLFVPVRDPRLSDVFWNMVGVGLGIGLALALQRSAAAPSGARRLSHDGLLLAGCLLVAWLPLVPTLDIGLLRAHLKVLIGPATHALPNAGTMAALAVFSAYLASRLSAGHGRRSGLAVPAVLLAIVVGQAVIPGAQLNVPGLVGVALGGALWWAWQMGRRPDTAVLAAVVVGLQTLSALAPFDFSPHAQAFGWQPFRAMLEGSMLTNAQALATEGWLWGAALLLAQRAGARVGGLSVALALWVLALEGLQCFLPSRTPDITPALVVLGVGWILTRQPMSAIGRVPMVAPSIPVAPAVAVVEDGPRTRRPVWTMLLLVAVPALGLAGGLYALLQLPGLPYNVVELFQDDGHPSALLAFALALLWLGAGAAWAGDLLARWPAPGWWVGPVALAAGLISLGLLSWAVTGESLSDVTGSRNLYRFVTEQQIWGAGWPEVFAMIGSPLVSTLERGVRYAALYGPLPIGLGGAIAAQAIWRQGGRARRRLLGLAVGVVLMLWLCQAIVFDWASTDNLTELIARDGPWGWGGGGYLYALLALLCGHAWALSVPVRLRRPISAWPWLALPVSVLLGWWLLNQGLESQVQKYGLVYSGAQFLLGPDRQSLLTEAQLLQRWAALQVAAMVVLALGLWLYRCIGGWVAGTQSARAPQTSTSVTTG